MKDDASNVKLLLLMRAHKVQLVWYFRILNANAINNNYKNYIQNRREGKKRIVIVLMGNSLLNSY